MESAISSANEVACKAIDDWASKLRDVSHEIWRRPELKYEEHFAHDTLTQFLQDAGFDVERHHVLETAFRAGAGKPADASTQIGVICEYDALPEIGHACGHNLIAEAGLAAAIGLKAVLERDPSPVDGRVVVLGTPAEEGGGGKIEMIEKGSFEGLSAAIMVHPCPSDLPVANVLSVATLRVTYKGRASHAAAFPWEGINALDAVVGAYTGLSMLRQQMKPAWRIHAVITNGGAKPNIIPEEAELEMYARAPTNAELEVLLGKVTGVLKGAAASTGCSVEIVEPRKRYSNMDSNSKMLELYVKSARGLGVEFERVESLPCLSTDMGNVSHVVPSIHPWYSIGTDAANHTRDFTAAADTEYAHERTLVAAKAMAMTMISVLVDPKILDEK